MSQLQSFSLLFLLVVSCSLNSFSSAESASLSSFGRSYDATTEPSGRNVLQLPPNNTTPLGAHTIPIFPTDPSTSQRCSCSNEFRPVCGTDGVSSYTYVNRCVLDCNIRSHPGLQLEYEGHCCDYSHCTESGQPVCDETGTVHRNLCFFEFVQCTIHKKSGKYIGIDNTFAKCPCNTHCSSSPDPICDNTGVTHRSMCDFRSAQCVAKTKYQQEIEVDYQGTCCGGVCLSMAQPLFPICDTNSQTHQNFCGFYVAQCVARKKFAIELKISHFGYC